MGREDWELSFGCVKFGVSVRRPGVSSRELYERNWNSRERSGLEKPIWLSSAVMVFKALSLDEITQEMRVDRKEVRSSTEPWGTRRLSY